MPRRYLLWFDVLLMFRNQKDTWKIQTQSLVSDISSLSHKTRLCAQSLREVGGISCDIKDNAIVHVTLKPTVSPYFRAAWFDINIYLSIKPELAAEKFNFNTAAKIHKRIRKMLSEVKKITSLFQRYLLVGEFCFL